MQQLFRIASQPNIQYILSSTYIKPTFFIIPKKIFVYICILQRKYYVIQLRLK